MEVQSTTVASAAARLGSSGFKGGDRSQANYSSLTHTGKSMIKINQIYGNLLDLNDKLQQFHLKTNGGVISEKTSPLRQNSQKRGLKRSIKVGEVTVNDNHQVIRHFKKRTQVSSMMATTTSTKVSSQVNVKSILEDIPSPFNNDRNNPNGPYHNGMLTQSMENQQNSSQRQFQKFEKPSANNLNIIDSHTLIPQGPTTTGMKSSLGTFSNTPDITLTMIVNHSPKNARHTSLGLKTQNVVPVSQLPSGGRVGGLFTLGHTLNSVPATSDRKFCSHRGGSIFVPPSNGEDSLQGPVTLNQVKKSRRLADTEVQKLHNRIKMLQHEEDKALKKIEETRRKAKNIIEIRLNNNKRRMSRDMMAVNNPINTSSAIDDSVRPMTPDVRSVLYFERKEEHRKIMADRLSVILQKRREDANSLKKESKVLSRRKVQIDKAYNWLNTAKRMEIQFAYQMAQERIERDKRKKLEENVREKEKKIHDDLKIIRKREKQQRLLEQKEAEILLRLKQTHLQQKEVISDIQHLMMKSSMTTTNTRQQSPNNLLKDQQPHHYLIDSKFNSSVIIQSNPGVLSHDTIIGPNNNNNQEINSSAILTKQYVVTPQRKSRKEPAII